MLWGDVLRIRESLRAPAALPAVRRLLLMLCAAVLVWTGAGCGGKAHYRFPRGKTLVYVISQQSGYVDENGEEVMGPMNPIQEVRFLVLPNPAKDDKLVATSHPPEDGFDPIKGRELGKINFRVDRYGNITEATGAGLGAELRYLIPTLPPGLSSGDTWEEQITVHYKYNKIDLTLKHEYVGVKELDDVKCDLVEGRGTFEMNEEVKDPAKRVYAEMSMEFTHNEDYCFDFSRGLLLRTVIYQKRKRLLYDKLLEKAELDRVDLNRTLIELVDVR